jgi:hypothetical protein
MKKIIVTALILVSNIGYGQTSSTNFKCECTDATKLIIDKLQSLTSTFETDFVEFRVYGNDSMRSEKFIQYVKLYDTASESELVSILGIPSLNVAVRGYVYMAYAFHCDKEKRKEKALKYTDKNVFIHVQNGYEIQRDMLFPYFKSFCRMGDKYNPHPNK